MSKFKIQVNCHECDGYGVVSDRHPIDPSGRDVQCQECDGVGSSFYIEEYDSIADAQDDYPEATGFTYLQSSKPINVSAIMQTKHALDTETRD